MAAQLITIDKGHILSICEALDHVAMNQCKDLINRDFTFHVAYALALMTRIYLEHPSCTNKSPENMRICMEDVIHALEVSMRIELEKLNADIAAGRVK